MRKGFCRACLGSLRKLVCRGRGGRPFRGGCGQPLIAQHVGCKRGLGSDSTPDRLAGPQARTCRGKAPQGPARGAPATPTEARPSHQPAPSNQKTATENLRVTSARNASRERRGTTIQLLLTIPLRFCLPKKKAAREKNDGVASGCRALRAITGRKFALFREHSGADH